MRHLTMSEKERERKVVMSNVMSGHCSLKEGACKLGISYRQAIRIKQRYKEAGDEGLVHKSRGRPGSSKFSEAFKASVLKRYQEDYENFGVTLAQEKLEQAGYKLNRETLRQWLMKEKLWHGKPRKYKHRSRRPRKSRFGDLLQIDGSIHKWFSDDRYSCLLNAVDDATSTTYALMRDGETKEGVLSLLQGWISQYGIPKAVYVDLKSVYIGPKEGSAFQEICERLGIEVIKAYSPQAKGRVERYHAIYQDRLVKEIGLRGLETLDEVNELLQGGFIRDLNQRFSKAPLEEEDGHVSLEEIEHVDLWFYKKSHRVLQNDWCVSFKAKVYQLAKQSGLKPRISIEIREYLDGRLLMYNQGKQLAFKLIEPGAKPIKKAVAAPVKEASTARKPSNSPWRKFNPHWLKSNRSPPKPKLDEAKEEVHGKDRK